MVWRGMAVGTDGGWPEAEGEGSWRNRLRRGLHSDLGWLALTLAVSVAGYWVTPGADTRKVGGDGRYHLMLARSMVEDGDWDLTDEYAELGDRYGYGLTSDGRARIPFHVGTAFTLAPGYAVGSLFFDAQRQPSHFEGGLAKVAGLGTVVCAVLFVWVVARVGRRWTAGPWAWATAWAFTASLPVLYYAWFHPTYTHVASALCGALVAWMGLRWVEGARWIDAVALGAAIGAAGLVRTQNLLFCAFPVVLWLGQVLGGLGTSGRKAFDSDTGADPGTDRRTPIIQPLAERTVQLAVAGAVAALVFSVQLAVWSMSELPWFRPYGDTFLRLNDPALSELLFSTRNGLVPWSPAVWLSVIGFGFALARRPTVAVAALVAVAIQTWVNASAWDWYASWSYGARRFSGSAAFFGLMAVPLVAWLAKRESWGGPVAGVLLAFFGLLGAGMTVNEGCTPGPRWKPRAMLPVYIEGIVGWGTGLCGWDRARKSVSEPLADALRPTYDALGNPAVAPFAIYLENSWGLRTEDYELDFGRFNLYRDFKNAYPHTDVLAAADAVIFPKRFGGVRVDGNALVVLDRAEMIFPAFRSERVTWSARMRPHMDRAAHGLVTLNDTTFGFEVERRRWVQMGEVDLKRGFNRFSIETSEPIDIELLRFDVEGPY